MKAKNRKSILIVVLAVLSLGIVIIRIFTDTVLSGWIFALCLSGSWGIALCIKLWRSCRVKTTIVTILIVIAVSVLLTFLYRYMLPKETVVIITATGEKNEASNGTEVWLNYFAPDGKPYDLTKYVPDDWQLINNVPVTNKGTIEFKIKRFHNLHISFVAHPWSGIIEITTPAGTARYDLYRAEGEASGLDIDVPFDPLSDDINPWALDFAFVLAVICALVTVGRLDLIMKRYSRIKNLSAFKFIYPVLTIMMLIAAKHKITMPQYDWSLVVIAVGLTIMCMKFFTKMTNDEKFAIYFKWNYKIGMTAVSMWCAFAIVAFPLFFLDSVPKFGISSILVYILVAAWFVPVIYSCMFMLDKYQQKQKHVLPVRTSALKPWMIFFILNFITLTFFTLGYWPGNFSSDGADMWSQAVGKYDIRATHSATATLLMRLCYQIYRYPYSFVIFQSVCFSALIATIFIRLYRQGWKFSVLACISVIAAVIPSTYGMLSHIKASLL